MLHSARKCRLDYCCWSSVRAETCSPIRPSDRGPSQESSQGKLPAAHIGSRYIRDSRKSYITTSFNEPSERELPVHKEHAVLPHERLKLDPEIESQPFRFYSETLVEPIIYVLVSSVCLYMYMLTVSSELQLPPNPYGGMSFVILIRTWMREVLATIWLSVESVCSARKLVRHSIPSIGSCTGQR